MGRQRHRYRQRRNGQMTRMSVAGCWLLVAGCWLLVAGCWLLALLMLPFRVPVLLADDMDAFVNAEVLVMDNMEYNDESVTSTEITSIVCSTLR